MIIFLNLFKVRARAAKVIFVCCFRDPRGLLSRERDMFRPPNIWSLTAIIVIDHSRIRHKLARENMKVRLGWKNIKHDGQHREA